MRPRRQSARARLRDASGAAGSARAARPIRGREARCSAASSAARSTGALSRPSGRILAVAAIVGYYAAQLPGASEWQVPDRPPNIQILAVDGRLIGNRGDTGGETVRIEQLPDYVPEAVIAIEDRRFRSHFGVDPVGLVRAVAKNAFAGGVVEGGSTLTQQLAKNMFLTPERSLKRKVQEVVLAVWLETKYSKDEILEMYLNRVYFGAGAYGIDAAARRYFDREARALTLPQAAMLAGLLPAPSRYCAEPQPGRRASSAPALVLAAMREQGYISAARAGGSARPSRRGRLRAYEPQRELRRRLGDGRAALPCRRDRARRGGGDDGRPRPAGARRSGRSSTRSPRRARNTASARAPWWRSTAPAPCAPWWAAAPMRRASSTAPSMRGGSPAPRSSPSST